MTSEQRALHRFLQAQRDSVVAIVAGLDDHAAERVVVPSGWSPVDMVDHLRGAERYWLSPPDSADPEHPDGRTISSVLDAYRRQWRVSDAVIAATALDAPTRVAIPEPLVDDVRDFRDVLLHLIEETARHAGHLDVARELIDGRTGLGPR